MLKPCRACARLVRAADAACPFCGASVRDVAAPPVVRGRSTRAAAIAAVALGVAACGGATEPTNDGGTAADASVDAAKDAAPKDAAPDAPKDAGAGDVVVVPPYGVPPYGIPPTDGG